MNFLFEKSYIEGLIVAKPKIFEDSRGYFLETYSEKYFNESEINEKFVQDNMSKSAKGVIRGLHFQKNYCQAKLVTVILGEVYDIAVDLRNDSKTFGKYFGVLLNEENKKQFFIPKGFAHGFVVLSETAIFSYKCSDYYHPEEESGIIYNDKNIDINWNDYLSSGFIVSDKDLALPNFDYNKKYFSLSGEWIGE